VTVAHDEIRGEVSTEATGPGPGPGAAAPPTTGSLAILAVTGIGVLTLVRAFDAAHQALGLLLVAFWLAGITLPATHRLRRRLPAGAAAALVAIGTLLVVLAAEAALFRDLRTETNAVRHGLDAAVGRLQGEPARVLRSSGVVEDLDRFLAQLPTRVLGGDGAATSLLTRAAQLVAIVVLAAFVQVGARPLRGRLIACWPVDQRPAVARELHALDRRGLGYQRRTVVLSLAVLAGAAAVGWAWRLPGPVALGAWAAVWATVPLVGLPVGAAPMVVLAWAHGPGHGWAVTAVALGMTVVVWRARRRVERSTVRLGPPLTLVALLVGFLVGGLPMALVVLSGATLAVVWALGSPQRRIDPPFRLADRWMAAVPLDGGRSAARRTWRRAIVGAVLVLAALLLWWLVRAAASAVVLASIGGLLALAVDRPVSFLQRWVGRVTAIAAVWAVIVLAVAGLAVLAGRTNLDAATALTEDGPAAVADAERLPVVGEWIRDARLAERAEEALDRLPEDLLRGGAASRLVGRAGAGLGAAIWVTGFVIGLLVDGPRVLHRVVAIAPGGWRERLVRIGRAAYEAVAGYAAGAALVALLNATMVLIVALALRLPVAPVLAGWAFITNFVPQIGGFLGGAPLVALAATRGPVAALVAAGTFIAYQNLENHVIQPAVVSNAIDVPPWITLAAALIGGALAGAAGAVLATPLAALGRAAALGWSPRRAGAPAGRVAGTTPPGGGADDGHGGSPPAASSELTANRGV
jgi:predicted PurR-regulated permease PerM